MFSHSILFAGLSDTNKLVHSFNMMKDQYKVYLDFFVYDNEQNLIFSSMDYNSSVNSMINENCNFQSIPNGVYFSDVFLYPYTENSIPAIITAVAYFDENNNRAGFLAAVVDLRLLEIYLKKSPIEQTGEIYLVNSKGYFITSSRHGAQILKDKIQLHSTQNVSLIDGVLEYVDYRGQKVLHAHKKIDNSSWLVVVEQDQAELFQQIWNLRNQIILIGIVTTVVILIFAYTGSSWIVNMLKRSYNHEKEMEFHSIQKSKLAALGLLTSGLAHELNTPLATALLYTQMLQEDVRHTSNQEYFDKLSIIEAEIKQGSNVVRNLLDFARLPENDSKRCDVNKVLDRLLPIANPQCIKNKITVIKQLQSDLPLVEIDESIVKEVLTNLIANAIDAMPAGGSLKITTRFIPILKKIRIDISDTGQGISEDDIDKVFDPFFTTKRTTQGSGLGLFVSYEMIKKLGGNMRVISSQNTNAKKSGTIFTVELPESNPI